MGRERAGERARLHLLLLAVLSPAPHGCPACRLSVLILFLPEQVVSWPGLCWKGKNMTKILIPGTGCSELQEKQYLAD